MPSRGVAMRYCGLPTAACAARRAARRGTWQAAAGVASGGQVRDGRLPLPSLTNQLVPAWPRRAPGSAAARTGPERTVRELSSPDRDFYEYEECRLGLLRLVLAMHDIYILQVYQGFSGSFVKRQLSNY